MGKEILEVAKCEGNPRCQNSFHNLHSYEKEEADSEESFCPL